MNIDIQALNEWANKNDVRLSCTIYAGSTDDYVRPSDGIMVDISKKGLKRRVHLTRLELESIQLESDFIPIVLDHTLSELERDLKKFRMDRADYWGKMSSMTSLEEFLKGVDELGREAHRQ